MKWIVLLVCAVVGLLFGQELRPGNFNIRVEPSAKLQTGAQIPFVVIVKDPLRKPVRGAKVLLRIENTDPNNTKTYPALATESGSYLAKPVFPSPGQWTVAVEVRRGDEISSRTTEVSVSN